MFAISYIFGKKKTTVSNTQPLGNAKTNKPLTSLEEDFVIIPKISDVPDPEPDLAREVQEILDGFIDETMPFRLNASPCGGVNCPFHDIHDPEAAFECGATGRSIYEPDFSVSISPCGGVNCPFHGGKIDLTLGSIACTKAQ